MPFITEEIYQEHYKGREKSKSIHLTEFEKINSSEKIDSGDIFIKILSSIRQEKSNNKKPMNSEIILTIQSKDFEKLKNMLEDLKDVANAKEIKQGEFKVEFV